MEKQPVCENFVNVLGLRLGDFAYTETAHYLKESGIYPAMLLPGKTSPEEIRTAPKAKCNLVVHPVGLPLARAMQEKFGTPYVMFERYSDPDRIYACYKALYDALGKELPKAFESLHTEMKRRTISAKERLAGKTYICGKTLYDNKGALQSDLLEWTPIGTITARFAGEFDGQGHTISGLYFNDTSKDYVGLFGYAQGAEIKNVGVVNSYFSGNNYVGGVCGYVNTGTTSTPICMISVQRKQLRSAILPFLTAR